MVLGANFRKCGAPYAGRRVTTHTPIFNKVPFFNHCRYQRAICTIVRCALRCVYLTRHRSLGAVVFLYFFFRKRKKNHIKKSLPPAICIEYCRLRSDCVTGRLQHHCIMLRIFFYDFFPSCHVTWYIHLVFFIIAQKNPSPSFQKVENIVMNRNKCDLYEYTCFYWLQSKIK